MRSLTFILFFIFSANGFGQNAAYILTEMVNTCYNVQSLNYTQCKSERIEGELHQQVSDIKFQKSPFMVYMKQKSPKEGLEVLFKDGQNDNNALINTNGFPWVNISLSPFGDKMRDGQHHTVYESGFHYFATIVDHLTTKYKTQTDQLLKFQGTVSYNDRLCYKIFVDNRNFEYVSHKVRNSETVQTIAKHYFIPEHQILESNADVDDYYDVDPDDIIIRPNDYAKSITLLVDIERHIPLKLIVHDDKGLYEQYEFLDLTLNPIISIEEFDKEYKNYGF